MESEVLLKKMQEAMDEWFRRAIVAEEKMLGFRKALEQRDKDNAELHARLDRENESANKHFTDSKKKDVEIAELKTALVNAGKENKELKDKLSISDFWKNAASNLREELSRVENIVITLQKKYDDAVSIGLGYMNQCEKAQSELESLKGGVAAYRTANGNLYNEINKMKDVVAKSNTLLNENAKLTDDLQLAKARLEYSNGLVDKMGKEKQWLLDQLTGDENKIAGLQEQIGRYAAECSKLNIELVKANNELAVRKSAIQWPYTVTVTTSGNVGIGNIK